MDFKTRTGLDQSNISGIVAPTTNINENQILNIKENGLSKLESIRTKAGLSLPHLLQPKKKKNKA